MPFTLLQNGQILEIKEIVTDMQTAISQKHYGMSKKVEMVAEKIELVAGEELTVNLQWLDFDLIEEDWLPCDRRFPFQVQIAQKTLTDLEVKQTGEVETQDGTGQLIFSSAEPGTFVIKTVNPGVDNASLEVFINAA